MSRWRKVDVRLWGDERVRKLSKPAACGLVLWLYLLTAKESVALPGAVSAGPGALSEALGWPRPAFLRAFSELEAQGMAQADWAAGLVWLPNALKFNPPQSPNAVKAWAKAWEELPDCDLKRRVHRQVASYLEAMGEAFAKAFPEASPQAIADPEAEQIQRGAEAETDTETAPRGRAVREVFEHWQKTLNHPNAKLTAERERVVNARLKQGYSVDDLKQAIDGCAKTPHNIGHNETGQHFDDLELICRKGSQVERFMANAVNPPKPKTNGAPIEAVAGEGPLVATVGSW